MVSNPMNKNIEMKLPKLKMIIGYQNLIKLKKKKQLKK